MAESLEPKYRDRLARNLTTAHYARFRLQILAWFAAMARRESRSAAQSYSLPVDLDVLKDEEHYAIVYVFGCLQTRRGRNCSIPLKRHAEVPSHDTPQVGPEGGHSGRHR